MNHEKVTSMIAHLRDKMKQQAQYIVKLERSIAVEQLVPNAFKKGKVSTLAEGNPREPDKMLFIVKAGDEEFTFPLWEVPTILWYHHLTEICTHGHTIKGKWTQRKFDYDKERKAML